MEKVSTIHIFICLSSNQFSSFVIIFLQKFFRKKSFKELLPPIPVESVLVEPWWVVQAGYITEDDVKVRLC